ncbi:MAG TPA: hypothetical protein PLK82_07670, partial [Bacteroidales bacterium]|nr:hypothetical protein [Bacteroidales bacterium]
PGGLGLYTASELTFTLAPNVGYSSTNYEGNSLSDNRVNLGVGNFGVVLSMKPYVKGNHALRYFNIGIGFNRQNDFNNRVAIRGINNRNSLMQSFADKLNNPTVEPWQYVEDDYPFDLGLAYATNLVVYDTLSNTYFCDAAFGGVTQDKIIETQGSMNELDLAMGANISDKLFVGLTFGIPTINYYEYSTYKEWSNSDTVPNFISLTYKYDLHTKGTGFNLKAGLIYKPVKWMRIGAAIHTPTWYPSMTDRWYSSMESSFTNTSWNSYKESPVGTYDYRLTTPFRAFGSLAFIVGRLGLISADYEYVDYSQARFNSSGDNFSDVNQSIKSDYGSWGNLRIGTEWRLDNFRIRGGFGYFSNPYTRKTNNSERFQISGGIGYRGKNFFADGTYTWSRMNQNYYLYDASMVNPAAITSYTHTVSMTVGVRF